MKDSDLKVGSSTSPVSMPVTVPTIYGNGGNLVDIARQFHQATNFPSSSDNNQMKLKGVK